MNIDRRDTRGSHIYSIRVHAKLAKVSKCRLCFGTGDFASFDIYARGEYLVVRTLNDTILCVRGCGKFRANSRKRERERDEKTTRKRIHGVCRNSRGWSVARETTTERKEKMLRERDSPCWRTVGLTVRERCKSSVRPLCRVLLRYNWKTEKENFILLNFYGFSFRYIASLQSWTFSIAFLNSLNYSIIFILFNHLLWSIDHKQKKYLKLTNKLFTANSIARFRFYPQPLIKQRFNAIHVYDDTWKKRLQGSETFPSPRTPPLESSFRPPIRKFWTVRSANFCIPITR